MNVKEWKFKQVKQRFKIAYYLNHLGLCRNLFSAGLAQTLPLNPILNQVFSYHFKLLRKLYNPKSSSTRNKHSFMNLKKIYCLPVNWITAIEQDNLSTNLYASLSFGKCSLQTGSLKCDKWAWHLPKNFEFLGWFVRSSQFDPMPLGSGIEGKSK